ncbi:MAG: ornithine cyclodeaminase family protein [Gemmatimonadetes bacterium]|nr:ornithine cyclodeaminase family protein [Gemmatimonadota bacterium]
MTGTEPLLLQGDDLRGLVALPEAVDAVRTAYLDHSEESGLNILCHRLQTPDLVRVCAHQGAAPTSGGAGVFVHSELMEHSPTEERLAYQAPPVTVVYSAHDARLEGILVGEPTPVEVPDTTAIAGVRTAATSVVGTLALIRPGTCRLGVIGTGRQAELHILAIAEALDLESVLVYSRSPANRSAFAARMTGHLGVEVVSVDTAEQVVRNSGAVITSTNAVHPVLEGRWLSAGQHVTSIVGGMVGTAPRPPGFVGRRELDDEVDARADVIALASREQAAMGFTPPRFADLAGAHERVTAAYPHWQKSHELSDILSGHSAGRGGPDDITVFKNNAGQGIADVAIAMLAIENARRAGKGTRLAS